MKDLTKLLAGGCSVEFYIRKLSLSKSHHTGGCSAEEKREMTGEDIYNYKWVIEGIRLILL